MSAGDLVSEAKHTALPWRVAADGFEITTSPIGFLESSKRICDTSSYYKDEKEARANAAFVVRACNAHDDLVKALERARDDLEDTAVLVKQGLAQRENILRSIEIKVSAARAALAKAGTNN